MSKRNGHESYAPEEQSLNSQHELFAMAHSLWAALARPSKGRKSRAVQLGSSISTSILAFISGILGVVSLYKEDQSKGLFHTYQAWIVFNLIIIIPVRYF